MEYGEPSIIGGHRIYYGDKTPGAFGFVFWKEVTLVISDPEILEVLYVKKNKYFDKHPRVYNLFKPILGESILLAKSNESWSKKRKSLSTAFYKDKLGKMMKIIKDVIKEHIQAIEKNHIQTGQQFDLPKSFSDLQVKIILRTAFGLDLGEKTLPYKINGEVTQQKFSHALKQLLN